MTDFLNIRLLSDVLVLDNILLNCMRSISLSYWMSEKYKADGALWVEDSEEEEGLRDEEEDEQPCMEKVRVRMMKAHW